MYFKNCLRDLSDILFGAEEQVLGEPDRFVGTYSFCHRAVDLIVIWSAPKCGAVQGVIAEAGLKGRLPIQRTITGRPWNSLGGEGLEKTIAAGTGESVGVVTQDIEMVGVSCDAFVDVQRGDALDVGQMLRQQSCIFRAHLSLRFEVAHLAQQEGGLKLRHTVIATDEGMFVPLSRTAATAVVDGPRGIGEGVVVRQDEASLACIQILAGLKAECAQIADRTDATSLPLGAVRLGGILDEAQTVGLAQFRECIEIRGLSTKMNRDDNTGSFGESRLDGSDINAICIGVNIDEYGNCPDEGDGGSGGDEGVRRDDDLVTQTDTCRFECDLQSGGAAADSAAVAGLVKVGKYALDLGDAIGEEPLAGVQYVEQGGLIFGTEDRPRGKSGGSDGGAAAQGEGSSVSQTLMPCCLRYADTPFLFMVRRARAESRKVTVRSSSGI